MDLTSRFDTLTSHYFVGDIAWRPYMQVIFTNKSFKWPIAKIVPFILYYRSWCSNPCDDVSLHKFFNHFRIISSSGFCFHPIWHIINSKKKPILLPPIKPILHMSLLTINMSIWGIWFRASKLLVRWQLSYDL